MPVERNVFTLERFVPVTERSVLCRRKIFTRPGKAVPGAERTVLPSCPAVLRPERIVLAPGQFQFRVIRGCNSVSAFRFPHLQVICALNVSVSVFSFLAFETAFRF